MTKEPDRLRALGSRIPPVDLCSEAVAFDGRGSSPANGASASTTSSDHSAARHIDHRRVESFAHETIKRCFDIGVALLLGLLALPVVAGLAIFIVADSGRPVLFWQNRVGRFGRRFRLLKLRTLPRDVLKWPDETWYVQPDSRLMEVVRRTGMDELPQLWNVIRGEMSLVGPRPERPVFVEGFQARLPQYSLRHLLRPGLTGWAQIHGWRGDTSIGRRLEYDLDYLEHWSLGLDLRILARTAVMVLQDLFRAHGAPAK